MLEIELEIFLSFIRGNQDGFNKWIDKKNLLSIESLLVLGFPAKRVFELYDHLLSEDLIVENDKGDKLKLSNEALELLSGDVLIMRTSLSV